MSTPRASDLDDAPLSGIRVLDLSRLLPGPFATMMLADLGATVDKVEDASAGDYLRAMPPHVDSMGAAFHLLNRGKRSMVLDLKKPEGKAALLRLIPRYDVLIESFRPGVMSRLGLGYEETLRPLHPGLVYCAITGYGQTGPARDRAGHDIGYLARAGVLGLTGPEDGAPQVAGVQMADVAGGGMLAVTGILAALRARETSGKGRLVDVSMCEGSALLGIFGLASAFAGDSHAKGSGPLNGGIAPFGTYVTKDDRSVALGALEPKFWMAFCAEVGIECGMDALMPGPHQAAWKARVASAVAQRTLAEWVETAARVDCCLEPVLMPDEVPSDPQHVARGFFETRALGDTTLPMMRTPIAAAVAPGSAPRQGEQSRAVLADAGFSLEEIDALIRAGATR